MSSSDFVIKNRVLTEYNGPGGNVDIPEGVWSIGKDAFSGCKSLQSVSIPEGVTAIGWGAFADCTALTSVVLPDGLETIGPLAFYQCAGLTGVTFPKSLEKIDSLAFFGCTGLRELTLPGGVYLDMSAFENCTALEHIVFQEKIPHEDFGLGTCISPFGTVTLHRPFEGCKALRTVEFREMKEIDWEELWYLSEFDITFSISGIPVSSVSKDWKMKALLSFSRQDTGGEEIPEEIRAGYLKYIKGQRKRLYEAALDAPELMQVMVREKMIPQADFDGIFEKAAQRRNPELTAMLLEYQNKNLVREDPVKKTGREFKALERQIKVQEQIAETNILPPGEAKKIWRYEKRDGGGVRLLGYKGTEVRVRIPRAIGSETVVELGDLCLSPKASPLTKALREARARIESVEIPDSIEVIRENVMLQCLKLTNIILSPDNERFYIRDGMLLTRDGARLLHVLNGYTGRCTVPDTLQAVGSHFQDKDITELVIPLRLLSDEEDYWERNTRRLPGALRTLTVTGGAAGGILWELCAQFRNLETVTLPEGVCQIQEGAFSGCTALKTVRLPDSLRVISKSAFASCHSLSGAALPGGLHYLGERAFAFNRAMTSVTVPGGVENIRKSAFEGCTSLETAVIQPGVQELGDKAFFNCKALKDVTLPASVVKIGQSVFGKCPGLAIHAPAGSYAERYARENNIRFEAL